MVVAAVVAVAVAAVAVAAVAAVALAAVVAAWAVAWVREPWPVPALTMKTRCHTPWASRVRAATRSGSCRDPRR